jgi:hypothetical protein
VRLQCALDPLPKIAHGGIRHWIVLAAEQKDRSQSVAPARLR